MKPIAEVYPDEARQDATGEWFYGPSDYEPLLESFGYEITLRVDDDDYQGDSRVLFLNHDNGEYGYLNFGWGSCSGCDALQACNTLAEIEKLRDELHESIKWGSAQEMYEYFVHHDWKSDYSWHEEKQTIFIFDATEKLREACSK
jgi:hypothetical protein